MVGEAARKVFAEAQEMLARIVRENLVVRRTACSGCYPAAR